MGPSRATFHQLTGRDPRDLSDDELAEHVAEIERASRALEAARARAIAEVDARRAYAAEGFLSTTSWIAHRMGVAASAAAQQVRLARALPDMPATRAALAQGSISVIGAGLLAGAREVEPAAFARSEHALVRAARTLPVRDLRRAIEHWRLLADAESGDEATRRRFERRGLYASHTIDGMVRLDGDLDPETGQTVLTALRAVVDATSRGADPDDRRPAQRRADALGEICARYLGASDRRVVAGERPHLTVTIDVDALRGGGTGELDGATPIEGEAVRRLACDSTVSRVVTRGRSEPIDVGRRTPVVPPALRRAIVVRDGGCRFPGCDRPPEWSDAHHVTHWADGGETSLANLVLLCRRHHRLVHDRFAVRVVDGRVEFLRPDGRALEEDRAPPGPVAVA
jgi:hypothetical protein